jgi:hypothetical protein
MGILTNIELALHTRLATLSGSPSIEWPNTHFNPTENTLFLRPTILPSDTSLSTLAGVEEHKGIYQVDVFVPLEKGVSALHTLLDGIDSLFKGNKTLTAGGDTIFIQAVSRGRTERQESWYVGFVEVNYLSYS